jgi:ABC-type multidrug transport system ATPase subunit/preprotein translocase subunit SecF
MAAYGLTPDQVLPALALVRREGYEMRIGLTDRSGREVPLVVRAVERRSQRARDEISSLRLQTPAGVLPLSALASVQQMPPPAVILHHNGRREVSVYYKLADSAPQSGPARQRLEEQIRAAVREVNRPAGTTVETAAEESSTSWFKRTLIPVLLLLFATLAVTFESFTLPIVILLSVPLTILGAVWALVLSGMPADLMALVGVVALLGLTVNPAILLVDRMQQRVRAAGRSVGAAALAAVRERTRPVLMTTGATVAGLWPLALATGRENEIWPPFATVVMGGLITSTLLTLLVIPAGFVLLARLDRTLGRLGPWVTLGWVAATTAVMAPLIASDVISTLTWQVVTTLLVAGLLLGAAVVALRRPVVPEPVTEEGGPPVVEVRYLHKIYGRPGPIGRALRLGDRFAERVLARGGTPFHRAEARERAATLAVILAGVGYLAFTVHSVWWMLVFALVTAVLAGRALREVRRWRGRVDALGRVAPGGPEGVLAAAAPWVAIALLGLRFTLLPWVSAERVRLPALALALVIAVVAFVQLGRWTAVRIAEGRLRDSVSEGWMHRPRTLWRRWSRRLFGFDLPREEIVGLGGVNLRVERGMVGVLGPNGAGKTTLLRLLAGILDPSVGAVTLGGVPIARLRRHLARWVGYLPQDFGLPGDLSAREYLDYYALLYGIAPEPARRQRIERLLEEVGLDERADERISGYSGGMRQRVAVARTLLRLPAVIIVDEPTVGLDPRERIRFRNLLARLAEGRVVLFSTHVVEDVAVACQRVVVLARGVVVFDGEPERLAEAARGRVWEAHLGPGEEAALPPEAIVVDRVPEADGRVRARLLCAERPHPEARPADPTLEDGYLTLVGTRLQRRVA